MQQTRLSLPVDRLLPEITQAIKDGMRQIIVRASPGSGKTTRIPPALLGVFDRQVWVLEPRRLAAKMSALRVASEIADYPKDVVGWQMRDDTSISKQTRLLFLTEGMFPLRMAQSPTLADVSCVVLDEFHERHAQTDVAFALTKHLQSTSRPDLALIVMSATLDLTRLQAFMPDAKVIDVEVPVYPVETIWWRGDPRMPLVDKVADGVRTLVQDQRHQGHILVFLPGTGDIVQASETTTRMLYSNNAWEVMQLRASLNRSEQERVFAEIGKRKIIFATNIAESSITIPGVTGVVDSGLARVPTFNRWSQVATLETRPVSQASVIQRAGRAGRTSSGVALRLFSENDYAGRPTVDAPELLRSELASLLLTLLGIRDSVKATWQPETLPWLDTPDPALWSQANALLVSLGITDVEQNLLLPQLAAWPVHPRIGRFLIACQRGGIAAEGAWLAAILSDQQGGVDTPRGSESLGCDLLARYDVVTRRTQDQRFANITRSARQLGQLLGISLGNTKGAHELHLEDFLLEAFGDRVAKARKTFQANTPREYTLCAGGDASLLAASAASHQDWIFALSMGATRASGSAHGGRATATTSNVTIDCGSGVSIATLIKTPSPWRTIVNQQEWDDAQNRVRAVERVTYGTLTLEEHRAAAQQPRAAEMVSRKLLELWPKPFANDDVLRGFVTRQKILHAHGLSKHVWDLEELKALLISVMADGAQSFGDVEKYTLEQWLRDCVGESEWLEVERFAPLQIKVGAGFMVPIHYEDGMAPWLAAKLQYFFGQMETPKILQGRVSLTLHLLAPNQVALQVTTDLASFWSNAYASLRNEYMRKYPRHYWPENPAEAEPPIRGSLKPKKDLK